MTGWATGESEVTLQTPGEVKTESSTMFVSANYFRDDRRDAGAGTGIRRGGMTHDGEPVVILGYQFWQNQLGSDPDIIGKTLTLDGIPHVVVGIAPDQFDGHLALHGKELFLPLERHPRLRDKNADNNVRSDRSNEWVHIHGRLSPGVSVAQASAAVSAVTSRLAKQYPATNEIKAGIVAPYDPIGNLAAFPVLASFRPSR